MKGETRRINAETCDKDQLDYDTFEEAAEVLSDPQGMVLYLMPKNSSERIKDDIDRMFYSSIELIRQATV